MGLVFIVKGGLVALLVVLWANTITHLTGISIWVAVAPAVILSLAHWWCRLAIEDRCAAIVAVDALSYMDDPFDDH